MKRIISFFLFLCAFLSASVPAFAESGIYTEEVSGYYAVLHDLDDSLSEGEEDKLLEELKETVGDVSFSICVVITDDVGSDKSDRAVIDYADVYYEEICGIDTDGILLLINNDTKYDWISTNGRCIDLFTDYRIDRLFDKFYDYLKDGDYYGAASRFVRGTKEYAEQGYDFSGEYDYDYDNGETEFYDDYDYGETEFSVSAEVDLVYLFSVLFIAAFFAIFFVGVVVGRYNLKAQKGAKGYVLPDSLQLSLKTDDYVRTYITRRTVSSGSSGSSHRRSSTHRSSGGGRHGGGGRHR